MLDLSIKFKNSSGTLDIDRTGTNEIEISFSDLVFRGDYFYKDNTTDTFSDFYTTNTFNGSIKFIASEDEFDDQIYSTSPGQACVFYLDNQVLGGGWISDIIN